MAQPATRTDVGLEILGARQMECVECHHIDSVAEFGRFITSRAGMGIVHCECPVCASKWRRVDVEMFH